MNKLATRNNKVARSSTQALDANHPVAKRLAKCAKACAANKFDEALGHLTEAQLVLARYPAPGADRAIAKAQKVLIMNRNRWNVACEQAAMRKQLQA